MPRGIMSATNGLGGIFMLNTAAQFYFYAYYFFADRK